MSRWSFYDAVELLRKLQNDLINNKIEIKKYDKDKLTDSLIMVLDSFEWVFEKKKFETVEYRIYSPVGLYLCFCELGVNIRWTLDLEDAVSFDSIREAKKTLNLIPKKERVEDGILIEEFREVRRKIIE